VSMTCVEEIEAHHAATKHQNLAGIQLMLHLRELNAHDSDDAGDADEQKRTDSPPDDSHVEAPRPTLPLHRRCSVVLFNNLPKATTTTDSVVKPLPQLLQKLKVTRNGPADLA